MLFLDGEGFLEIASLFFSDNPAFLKVGVRVFELLFAVLDWFVLSAHPFCQ